LQGIHCKALQCSQQCGCILSSFLKSESARCTGGARSLRSLQRAQLFAVYNNDSCHMHIDACNLQHLQMRGHGMSWAHAFSSASIQFRKRGRMRHVPTTIVRSQGITCNHLAGRLCVLPFSTNRKYT
jgi:hypothetical protein